MSKLICTFNYRDASRFRAISCNPRHQHLRRIPRLVWPELQCCRNDWSNVWYEKKGFRKVIRSFHQVAKACQKQLVARMLLVRVLEIYTHLCACLCLLVEQLRWKVPYAFSQSHSFHRRCRNTSTAAWRWDKRNLSFVECSTCLSPYCQVKSILVYGRTHANTLKLWCAKFFAPFLSRQVMLSHALCMYTKGLQLQLIPVFYHANPSPSATNISHRRFLVPLFPYVRQFLINIYIWFMLSCDMLVAQR